MNKPQTINIHPPIGILATFERYHYEHPAFAIAEFVDNSIQSFLDYREEIEKVHGDKARLKVEIEIDSSNDGRLIVRDNAAGINEENYPRAFRSAVRPPDTSGLSEFGLGMKSAAIWFTRTWMVRTTALGEPVEKTVRFDVDKIVADDLEELPFESRPVKPSTHFTEIILSNLNDPPQEEVIEKIHDHLASIYRVFIREGSLELRFNGQVLSYSEPKILCVPFYKRPSEEPLLWRKDIDLDLGTGLRLRGFAALRETIAPAEKIGFSMFRRKRLIEGSVDRYYNPAYIFGQSNATLARSLFGELHLEGVNVTHSKGRFLWQGNEKLFLDALKKELNAQPMQLLSQGRNYKRRAKISTRRTSKPVEEKVPPSVEGQSTEGNEKTPPPSNLPSAKELITNQTVSVKTDSETWKVSIEFSEKSAVEDWLSISDESSAESVRQVKIRMSLAHEFMLQYSGAEASQIEPLQRVAVAIALAEIIAEETGIEMPGTFRRIINGLLRDALWKP